MPFHYISPQVKLAAMCLYDAGHLDRGQICDAMDFMDFSVRIFFHIHALWLETGDVVAHRVGIPGQPCKLHCEDINYLLELIRFNPDFFLDELLDLLDSNHLVAVHFTTIAWELEWQGVSRKQLRKIAVEHKPHLRADFIRQMAQYEPEQIGCMDEMHKDERTLSHRRQRSWKVVEGSMTRELFLGYLENTVVSGQSLIMSYLF
ncbi:hypothetical protein ARMGADRAFT_947808 [Armillaria gallica]|uniref:Uncharacterized protein n=1 Tax=Armillaria gallica TaxID=47427 RepID=A0A2H3CII7_ARMGA|nr:hypothetical protein ARMGADRAFT_947808 [Armillaria gallica]